MPWPPMLIDVLHGHGLHASDPTVRALAPGSAAGSASGRSSGDQAPAVDRGQVEGGEQARAPSTTAGMALTSRMAVAFSPAVLWSPSVPRSWRSRV